MIAEKLPLGLKLQEFMQKPPLEEDINLIMVVVVAHLTKQQVMDSQVKAGLEQIYYSQVVLGILMCLSQGVIQMVLDL